MADLANNGSDPGTETDTPPFPDSGTAIAALAQPDQIRPTSVDDRQLAAIDLLVGGATHREVAETVGVQRTTVTNWVNHHPGVINALAQRRQELRVAVTDRMVELVEASIATVTDAARHGDLDAAIEVLRLVGAANVLASQGGPDAPDDGRARSRR
jgi:hypothetical protein